MEGHNADVIAFNVVDLVARLSQLTGTRKSRGKIYSLGMILTSVILIVCGDAMQTQGQLSADILVQGGQYIWFLKESQARLLADIRQFSSHPRGEECWRAFPELPHAVVRTTDKGHGRLERHTQTLMLDEQAFLNWPGVYQMF